MMKKFRSLAIVFGLFLGMIGFAGASPVYQGQLNSPDTFGYVAPAGAFSVVWDFFAPAPSVVGSSVTNIAIEFGGNTYNQILNLMAYIDGTAFNSSVTSFPGGDVTLLSFLGNLAPGQHFLLVEGVAQQGGAAFGGNIILANQIPEPGTLVLLGFALFALVLISRRRGKTSSTETLRQSGMQLSGTSSQVYYGTNPSRSIPTISKYKLYIQYLSHNRV